MVALPESGVAPGGCYSLDFSKYREFLSAYTDRSETHARNLAEIPSHSSPIRFDVDIKQKSNKIENLYSPTTDPLYVIEKINEAMLSLRIAWDIRRPLFLLMERPPRFDVKSQHVKHGFHVHVANVWLNSQNHVTLFERTRRMCGDRVFACGQEVASSFDDVTKKPWLMYGSSKSKSVPPYKVTACYTRSSDSDLTLVQVKPRTYVDIMSDGSMYTDQCTITDDINDWNDGRLVADQCFHSMMVYTLSLRMSLVNTRRFHCAIEENKEMSTSNSNRSVTLSSMKRVYDHDCDDDHHDDGDDDGDYDDDDDRQCDDVVTFKEVERWLMNLDVRRATDYGDWNKVFMALVDAVDTDVLNYEEGRRLFHKFSARCEEKYVKNNIEQVWSNKFKDSEVNKRASRDGRKVTLRTVRAMLNVDKPRLSKRARYNRSSNNRLPIEIPDDPNAPLTSSTDEEIARAFLADWNKKVLYLDNNMYCFDGTIWKVLQNDDAYLRIELSKWITTYVERAKSYISTALADDRETASEINRTTESIRKKVLNFSPKTGIVKAIKTICTTGAGEFNPVQMDNNEKLTAFENMVFCNETLEMRPGRPDDMLSRSLKCKYVPYESLSRESIEFVNYFYNSIFPDPEVCKYFQLSNCQIFGGRNIFKQYQVWTGVGHNGKSMCIKLYEEMLGPLFCKLNKSVLVSVKQDIGAANPDMYKLRGVRMAVTDEIAKSDLLNVGQTKLLSGGDSFVARDLYQTSAQMATIKAQFLPIIVCNDLPQLRDADEAAWRRERVIPFESYFAYDGEQDIPSTVDPSYVQLRDVNFVDKIYKHMNAFASCLLKVYIEFEKSRRGTPTGSSINEPIPDKVLEHMKLHRLQQNPIRILVDTKFVHDPQSNELLTFERICVLVNERRTARPLSLNDVIRITTELAKLRSYVLDDKGIVGFVAIS